MTHVKSGTMKYSLEQQDESNLHVGNVFRFSTALYFQIMRVLSYLWFSNIIDLDIGPNFD